MLTGRRWVSLGGWCGPSLILSKLGLRPAHEQLPFDMVRTTMDGLIQYTENGFGDEGCEFFPGHPSQRPWPMDPVSIWLLFRGQHTCFTHFDLNKDEVIEDFQQRFARWEDMVNCTDGRSALFLRTCISEQPEDEIAMVPIFQEILKKKNPQSRHRLVLVVHQEPGAKIHPLDEKGKVDTTNSCADAQGRKWRPDFVLGVDGEGTEPTTGSQQGASTGSTHHHNSTLAEATASMGGGTGLSPAALAAAATASAAAATKCNNSGLPVSLADTDGPQQEQGQGGQATRLCMLNDDAMLFRLMLDPKQDGQSLFDRSHNGYQTIVEHAAQESNWAGGYESQPRPEIFQFPRATHLCRVEGISAFRGTCKGFGSTLNVATNGPCLYCGSLDGHALTQEELHRFDSSKGPLTAEEDTMLFVTSMLNGGDPVATVEHVANSTNRSAREVLERYQEQQQQEEGEGAEAEVEGVGVGGAEGRKEPLSATATVHGGGFQHP